jgi:hypothetical protein
MKGHYTPTEKSGEGPGPSYPRYPVLSDSLHLSIKMVYDPYIYVVITEDDDFVAPDTLTIEVAMVGGGGGGGGASGDAVAGGSGAGAGGVLFGTMDVIAETTYPVVIGLGGIGGTIGTNGTKGGDTTFNGFTAIGGGAGRTADNQATTDSDGGSSGGASGSGGGDAGTKEQVDNGLMHAFAGIGGTHNDADAGSFSGGGGGGANENATGRTRGLGKMFWAFESHSFYLAEGGFGQGTTNDKFAGVARDPNSGHGGHGASHIGTGTGGNGGSGIIIIRYKLDVL